VAFQRKKPAAIGVKAHFPGFIEPALATSIEKVPNGARWIHEIKFDGYRVQTHIQNAEVRVYTRNGNDWTNRFKKVAADAWHIDAGSAIIDGEIVVPAADGTTDFSMLQNELKGRSRKIVLVALRPALSQRLRFAAAAAARAQKLAEEDHRRHRGAIFRKLRGRRPRDVRSRLQGRARGRGLQGPRWLLFLRPLHISPFRRSFRTRCRQRHPSRHPSSVPFLTCFKLAVCFESQRETAKHCPRRNIVPPHRLDSIKRSRRRGKSYGPKPRLAAFWRRGFTMTTYPITRTRVRRVTRQSYFNSSKRCSAAIKSGVSNPSVNRSYTGRRTRCPSSQRPWRAHK
jgi:hypothetical protein